LASEPHRTMNTIEAELQALVRNGDKLARLLALEKKRRGVSPDTLVFVGIADVAVQRWCEQLAVLKSRKLECDMFAGYLYDRILYAQHLGLVNKLPASDEALLHVGSEITWENVEHLLTVKAIEAKERAERAKGAQVTWVCTDSSDKDGKRT